MFRLLENFGDRRLDGRELGGRMAAVAVELKQLRKDAVLDVRVPRWWQAVELGPKRGGFAVSVLPGREARKEQVVTFLRHMTPSHRSLFIHCDREAGDPKKMQAQIAQQVVAALVGTRFDAPKQIRTGRRLLFEIALDDC